jgi:mitochondrial transcription factor 1
VLRRLQPSLPSTRPLDIIDLHPGVCLWSTTIHNALKPRYHVLVEPKKDAYKSYIDPLLKQQGSRYRHVSTLSDLLCVSGGKCLPDQIPVASNTIPIGGLNDSLLILANLTSIKGTGPSLRGSASATNLQRYVWGLTHLENSLHHYGLVRILAWLPDDEKLAYLPRIITDRRKFSLKLDLATHVNEVAGGVLKPGPSRPTQRQHDLAIISEQRVSQRVKASGVWNPESRRLPASAPPWYEIGLVTDAIEQLRGLPQKLPWQVELLALEDAWRQREEEVQRKLAKGEKTPEGQWDRPPENLGLLRSKFLTTRKATIVAQEWAKRQSVLDRREIALHRAGQSPSRLAAEKEKIQREAATLHAEMEKGRKDLAELAKRYIDDRRGFDQEPSLLQWDRRPAEPLVVTDDEFYPPKKMALLDLTPNLEGIQKLDNFDKQTCFRHLCSNLWRRPAQSVLKDLPAVVQGGFDEFCERVPDLRNLLKGGNPNLDDLRVRTISPDLLAQLTLALETWPFRLPTHEMIMNNSRGRMLGGT